MGCYQLVANKYASISAILDDYAHHASVKYYSPTTNVCIIRVARDQHAIAWAGLTLMTNVEGRRYIPNVIHLSGELNIPVSLLYNTEYNT
jgi:hypothetical protein